MQEPRIGTITADRRKMHPAEEGLAWLNPSDFAVLHHAFARHGRDYIIVVQDVLGSDPGTHELTFTHVVRLDYETRVRDEVWALSWSDVFTSYEDWQAAGTPDGYVWGVEWADARPGLTIVHESGLANAWSRRMGKPMFEFILETNQFFVRLIFHSLRTQKLSDDTGLISKTINRFPG